VSALRHGIGRRRLLSGSRLGHGAQQARHDQDYGEPVSNRSRFPVHATLSSFDWTAQSSLGKLSRPEPPPIIDPDRVNASQRAKPFDRALNLAYPP